MNYFALIDPALPPAALKKLKQLEIELYTDEKSPDTESRVEEVLMQHNIYYTKTESWIESEKLYETLYEMEV